MPKPPKNHPFNRHAGRMIGKAKPSSLVTLDVNVLRAALLAEIAKIGWKPDPYDYGSCAPDVEGFAQSRHQDVKDAIENVFKRLPR